MNRGLLLIALVAGGCATDVDALPSSFERPLPEEAWIDAPAGCDSVHGAVRVRATEVPELAALLDANGDVLCVDVIDLVAEQHPELFRVPPIEAISDTATAVDPTTSDPTPDPMRPSDPTSDPTPDPMRPTGSASASDDPTPDPMRPSDPTPDPMRPTSCTTCGDDPTPDPMRPLRYPTVSDPTPDPMRPTRSVTDRYR